MTYLLSYYLLGLTLLLLALPLGMRVLEGHPDQAWAAARPMGLILAALLHRLAGPLGLEPWSIWGLLPALPFLLAWSVWVFRERRFLQTWVAKNIASIVGIELVFAVSFLGATLLTAHDPAVFGTERLMDFALLKSIASAAAFPPPDPWLSGKALNYYWLGHHMAVLPGVLAGVPTAVTYNLALAYLFASLVQLSCVLLRPAAGSLRRALLGGAMVAAAGNLQPMLQKLTGASVANLHFDASRVIPNTITEFPLLSLLVGDLHAHVLLLPILLLGVIWMTARGRTGDAPVLPIVVVNLLFLATALGNPWNLAALMVIFATLQVLRHSSLPWWAPAPVLVLLPFLWPVSGLDGAQELGLVWVQAIQTSPLSAFALQWLVPLLLLLALVDWQLAAARLRGTGLLWLSLPLGLALHSPVAALCLAFALLLWLAHRTGETLWAALGIAGLILLCVPEIVYLRDFYPEPFQRMNTVFKFSYAAWPLLLLAAARAALLLLDTTSQRWERLTRAGLLLLLASVYVYAAQAIPQRLNRERPAPLLDGVAALRKDHPEDIALLEWLTPRLKTGDVCLEAPGVSYQWSGRIAALSGCSTILGWEDHERLWRGASVDIAQRRADADRLYLTTDPEEYQRLVQRYRIDWVIVGETELARYGSALPVAQALSLDPIYSAGTARVYRVSRP